MPTLIVHGKADTLILFEHAKEYSPKIPNASTLFLEGIGHDLPTLYCPQIITEIFNTFDKAKVKQA